MAIDLTGASWVGNDSPALIGSETSSYSVTFTSNNVTYNTITINNSAKTISYTTTSGTITPVYSNSAWTNSNYKTINITGGDDVGNSGLYYWLETRGTLTLASEFNKTKLTFTISYDLSSEEYAKLVELAGSNFVLVPILNDVDAHTYKNIDSGEAKTFYDFMLQWGSSFNETLIKALSGDWNYGSGAISGTNTVSYTTANYGRYLLSSSSTTVNSILRFALYKATVVDNIATPTGSALDTIGYSDRFTVSCSFTEE